MWAHVILIGVFATCASAASSFAASPLATSPLNVSIAVTDNTWLVANITNIGSSDIKLRKIGILEDLPTQKIKVFQAGVELPFRGIHVFRHFGSPDSGNSNDNTTDISTWHLLAAGQSIDTSFDIATTHDLSAGGTFEIYSESSLPYTDVLGSAAVINFATFTSNTVISPVDGDNAGKMYRKHSKSHKISCLCDEC
jgi:deuterolysin